MAQALGLHRLLIDYDSTLNPGQGNQPLSVERATLLEGFLLRWRDAGVRLYVLTASNPVKKVEALEASGLYKHFDDVLSSTMPDKFPSKGDFISSRNKAEGWRPSEQLLADDSLEAIQSTWLTAEGEARETHLSHTLRIPQHSLDGLLEKDLQFIDDLIFSPAPAEVSHYFSSVHEGRWFVDKGDSTEKCMLDSLPPESLKPCLKANKMLRGKLLDGRPDFAAIVDSQSAEDDECSQEDSAKTTPPLPSKTGAETVAKAKASASAQGKGKSAKATAPSPGKGKGNAKGPPAPAGGYPPPPKASSECTNTLGEGTRVEVTDGPHAGKRGVVVKVSGEGKDTRWRVQLDGDGSATWVGEVAAVDSPTTPAEPGARDGKGKGKQKAAAPPPLPPPRKGGSAAGKGTAAAAAAAPQGKGAREEAEAEACGEGTLVEVMEGPHAGRRGRVLKVHREGEEVRWRVLLEGGGPPTWAERVSAVGPEGDSKDDAEQGSPVEERGRSVPLERGAEEGAHVEVCSGAHAGRQGIVLKATGTDEDRRWRVQLDGVAAPTWVDDVRTIRGAAGGRTFAPPPRVPGPVVPVPVPTDYLWDDSESEATDPDMPSLVDY